MVEKIKKELREKISKAEVGNKLVLLTKEEIQALNIKFEDKVQNFEFEEFDNNNQIVVDDIIYIKLTDTVSGESVIKAQMLSDYLGLIKQYIKYDNIKDEFIEKDHELMNYKNINLLVTVYIELCNLMNCKFEINEKIIDDLKKTIEGFFQYYKMNNQWPNEFFSEKIKDEYRELATYLNIRIELANVI